MSSLACATPYHDGHHTTRQCSTPTKNVPLVSLAPTHHHFVFPRPCLWASRVYVVEAREKHGSHGSHGTWPDRTELETGSFLDRPFRERGRV